VKSGLKFAALMLLALNFCMMTPAFARDPGGTTTPFPLDYDADELVGLWTSPANHTQIKIVRVAAGRGQPDKLFAVIQQSSWVSQGYLYPTKAGFCGVMNQNDGRSFPVCVQSGTAGLSVQSARVRMYLSNRR
jgi:hypothetical protein